MPPAKRSRSSIPEIPDPHKWAREFDKELRKTRKCKDAFDSFVSAGCTADNLRAFIYYARFHDPLVFDKRQPDLDSALKPFQ